MSNAPCPMPHAPCPMPHAPCPMPNSQVHTNILKEFEYLVRQFGIS
ncbi:hypothetical protein [Nostoc sp.]